jgi:hypothetical protein
MSIFMYRVAAITFNMNLKCHPVDRQNYLHTNIKSIVLKYYLSITKGNGSGKILLFYCLINIQKMRSHMGLFRVKSIFANIFYCLKLFR